MVRVDEKINIEWLPVSLCDVTMHFNAHGTQLITRSLPQRPKNAAFRNCNFGGSIDLRTLPRSLRRFDVSRNSIRGKVHLTNLPDTIRSIRMDENKVTRVVVHGLPESLTVATFKDSRKVKVIWLDGNGIDSRVVLKQEVFEYRHQSDHMDAEDLCQLNDGVLRELPD